MTAAPELREQVGPYRVLRAIGSGGTARIDLARIDRAYGFQRHVVIKRPLEHLRADPAAASSLRREARIGGRLQHPQLVAMLDAGVHDGYDYLVLEYVHGCSLRTLMQTERPDGVRHVPLAVALGIVIDVARGLHHAHELRDDRGGPLGLVHRDVSPGNVLLGLDGAVKLADFGIAKETRVATLSGSMHGTVTYMAPEQCRGHAFDRRADLWALGVILWELVAHARLFWADNDVASLHKVLSGQIDRPRRYEPALSKELEDIVMRAVAVDPEKRFATAREMADALEAIATSEGHVIGARWIARSVEEVVGAKRQPWIAATTIPDPPRRSEGSLVAVIESLAPEAPRDVAFGPTDARIGEEGSVPTAPGMRVMTRRSRRALIAGLACVVTLGVAGGAVLVAGRGDGGATGGTKAAADSRVSMPASDTTVPAAGAAEGSAAATTTTSTSTSTSPSPSTSTTTTTTTTTTMPSGEPSAASRQPQADGREPQADGREPQADGREPSTATNAAAATAPKPPRGHHHRDPHPKNTTTASTTPPPPPPSQGSAAAPPPHTPPTPNVEWKPSMLLPTDSGSGKSKSSGH